jgi:anti-sigma factor RsiW
MSTFSSRRQFKLDHRWARAHMSAYIDGELAQLRRPRLDRHLAECAQCRDLLRSLRRMIAALGELPVPPGGAKPDDVAAAVRRRLPG